MRQRTKKVLPNYHFKFMGRSMDAKKCRSKKYSFWDVLYGAVKVLYGTALVFCFI